MSITPSQSISATMATGGHEPRAAHCGSIPTLDCLVNSGNANAEPGGIAKSHLLGAADSELLSQQCTRETSRGELLSPVRSIIFHRRAPLHSFLHSKAPLATLLTHQQLFQKHQDPLHHPRRSLARLNHSQSSLESEIRTTDTESDFS